MRQRLINSASGHHVATQKKAHNQKLNSKSQCLVGRVTSCVRVIGSEAACRGLPALPFHVYTMLGWLLRCRHGFARPQKTVSRNSTMGGRWQLVFHHDQLCASRQKPTVPRRHWRCGAGRCEIQPREIRLALPAVPAYARSSACDHCVSARTGNGNDGEELEKIHRRRGWCGVATRFFRSPIARSSRTGRENQLHPTESCS
jgi:hypothetical protein